MTAHQKMFTLAHLSDVHLGPLPWLPPAYWNAKRVLGFLNWHKGRKRAHLPDVTDALVADMKSRNPDHIVVTGDLINIGLPKEYLAAARWLEKLGAPSRVTVVPGNHDIYTRLRSDPGHEHWRPYMLPNAAGAELSLPILTASRQGGFPFVRRFGQVALIGVNSALPTRPFYAGGLLGPQQRASLANILDALGREAVQRVVLIHHPPLPGQAAKNKALADADELEAILERHGAELVLHGHNHRSMLALRSRTAAGNAAPRCMVPIVGVPSVSLGRRHKGEHLARYHLFHFTAAGGPIEMEARGLTDPVGHISEIERRVLSG